MGHVDSAKTWVDEDKQVIKVDICADYALAISNHCTKDYWQNKTLYCQGFSLYSLSAINESYMSYVLTINTYE